MNNFVFNPETGFKDTTAYPDPATETDVRNQLMSLHEQTQAFINGEIKTQIEAIAAGQGDEGAMEEILAQLSTRAPLESPALTGTPTINGKAASYIPTYKAKTLAALDWNAGTQTINIEDALITATSVQEIIPASNITTNQLSILQAANIVAVGQEAGSLTLKAFGTLPEENVPVTVIFRGEAINGDS